MKNIEDITNQEELIEEILLQNSHTTIDNIVWNERSGGVLIITPLQRIIAFAQIEHGCVVEKIYQQIYDEFDGFYFAETAQDDYKTWQTQSCEMGNICFQLNSMDTNYQLVWVPDKISPFQFEQCKIALEELNKINAMFQRNGLPTYEISNNLVDDASLFLETLEKRIDFNFIPKFPDEISLNSIEPQQRTIK